MHNFLGNKLPKSFDQVYQLNRDVQEVHERRQSNLIYMERCDSEFSKMLPLYSIPKLWNQFQINMHALQDLSIFQAKLSIKKALISVYLDSVRCRKIAKIAKTLHKTMIYILHLKGLQLFCFFPFISINLILYWPRYTCMCLLVYVFVSAPPPPAFFPMVAGVNFTYIFH